MKRFRLRRALLTAALALVVIAGAYWFAPTTLGGLTSYVSTNGISMEPRFHTGDLALVRPAATYRVGQVVAYRSSALHVVVLHRIIALDGSRYVFKGDNNDFVDPVRPSRSQLVGALWLRVPHGGTVLRLLHTPVMVGIVLAIIGLLVLGGVFETRERRRRRRGTPPSGTARPPAPPSSPRSARAGRASLDPRPFLLAAGASAAGFLIAAVAGFATPATRHLVRPLTYTQSAAFGYSAAVAPGPVYPDGRVHTGQPIFLHLVRQLDVSADYRLIAAPVSRLHGVAQMVLVLTGATGWSRTFTLTPARRFDGAQTTARATVDLPFVAHLLGEIQALTGVSAEGGYSVSIGLKVHVAGTLGGHALNQTFAPALSFGLQPLQLQPGGSGPGSGGLVQIRQRSVPATATVGNHLTLLGMAIDVGALRLLSVVGFVLGLGASVALLAVLQRREPFAETERIKDRYGHLIVPVVAAPEVLEQVPYDVPDIASLVRLAESGQRLILHHRAPIGDTYLVSDDSSVFRYRPGPGRVVWGEWSVPAIRDPAANGNGHARPPVAPAPAPAGAVAAPGVPLSAFESSLAKPRWPGRTVRLAVATIGLLTGASRQFRR